jgi:heat-inducible transcriptional repressor
MTPSLGEREDAILRTIITSYIDSGEPVGSRVLSKKLDFVLSPATIRNIMADLEEMGFLQQPHISAGRIPTDKAYRFFVDSVLRTDLPETHQPEMESHYRSLGTEPGNLMRGASRSLSDISHYIGLVMAPRFIGTVLKHVEFVKFGPGKILGILVSSEGLIQNRLIEIEGDLSQGELDDIGAILNTRFANLPLREARQRIVDEMTRDKELYDSLLRQAMSIGSRSLDVDDTVGDLYVEGTSNLLSLPDFGDIEQMRTLFRTFEEKSALASILDRCIDAEGVQLFIGAENSYSELKECALITAPYHKDSRVIGVIGVLGPTRMPYDRVIPVVQRTAELLSRAISGTL